MTNFEFLMVFSIAPVSAMLFGLAMLWFTRPRETQRLHPGE